jgi:hypothetical protein
MVYEFVNALEASPITGANAGEALRLPMGTRWAASVAQFFCSAERTRSVQ